MPCNSASLFALFYESIKDSPTEAFLFVPPFADEMNKSRRMVTLLSQNLQTHGYAVLILDLFGTGDSQGEFPDATWELWRDSLYSAWRWLKSQGFKKIHFWGVRLGCLLALDTKNYFSLSEGSILFWQPVVNGERYVTQLIRLRIAEQFGKKTDETVRSLREMYSDGEYLEIAGYVISPHLLSKIESLQMIDMSPKINSQIFWLECSMDGTTELSAGSVKIIQSWKEKMLEVHAECVSGVPFWNSADIIEVPSLIDRTCAYYVKGNERNPRFL